MSVVILLRDDSKEINKLRALNECTAPVSKHDLPRPSFRKIDADYKRKPRRRNSQKLNFEKHSYFRYDEPTPEELMNRVEYDMDDLDEGWLRQLNERLRGEYGYELSESDFERIMDRLEKESYFESKSTGKEIIPEVDDDAVCAICLNGDSQSDTNRIIFCDMCDIPVHQECYGVPYIPEGQWLCRRCLQSPSSSVECVLCPNKGGAFKQTDDGKWAHVICALWIPEAQFANTVFLEPIDLHTVPKDRYRLACYICKQKRIGACIQCRKKNCYAPFHVTCAQQAGLYMRIRTQRYENDKGAYFGVKHQAYCDAHAPKDKPKKQGMYSSDETETEEVQVESKNYHKKREAAEKRESISKTRKILAEKRASDPNPISEPTIKREKLVEISTLITFRGGKTKIRASQQEPLRQDIIRHIEGYWMLKRKERKGVPLLRRLQVSFGGNVRPTKAHLDEIKYTHLRYDLEKARLLVGETKKRELLKKRLLKLDKKILEKRLEIINLEKPATED